MSSNQGKHDLDLFKSAWNAGEWAVARQMLSDITSLFKSKEVQYFICFGTFLGAVRHRGIIPWDDDIDFAILSEEEARLKALEPELNQLGYSICEWSIPWGKRRLDFYKIWISSKFSDNSLPFSWPFIDVFVFRPSNIPDVYFDGQLKIHKKDLLPLKCYPFASFDLPGPATVQALVTEYGPDFATQCVSNPHDHKLEQPKTTVSAPIDRLKASGYCVDIHLEDHFGLQKQPRRANGISLNTQGDSIELVHSNGTRFVINSSLSLIWQWADGRHNVAQMIDSINEFYQRPVIEATTDVIDAIGILIENKLISIE